MRTRGQVIGFTAVVLVGFWSLLPHRAESPAVPPIHGPDSSLITANDASNERIDIRERRHALEGLAASKRVGNLRDPAASPRPNSPEIVRDLDPVNIQQAELERRVSEGVTDLIAEANARSELESNLHGDLAGVAVEQVTCVPSVCRIDVELSANDGTQHAFEVGTLYSLPCFAFGGVVVFPEEATGNLARMRIYAMREGHRLPDTP